MIMKIAWFTPFNKKSAIGKYSKLATDELSKYVSVDIFVFERDNLLETKNRTIFYTVGEDVLNKLNNYDVIVYNMGDYAPYHEKIFEILRKKRGIVIIHDTTLLGFFYGYYSRNTSIVDFYNLYSKLYCESPENAFSRYMSKESSKFGFMDYITRFCCGVIVHSDFHADIIKKVYNGPLCRIYFPFSQECISCNDAVGEIQKDAAKVNMLTVGNINKNKRVFEVVQAIGKSDSLKNAIIYHVIGSKENVEYINQIEYLINKYDLHNTVKLIGYVDDNTLAAYYRDADVLCNLRNPALEGASWSLVEQMSLGKPIIVSDNGFYSEIPGECVFKISLENEEEELAKTLLHIIRNKDVLSSKGESAKKFVDENFNQGKYAKSFMKFIERIVYGKPIEALMNKLTYHMNQFRINSDMKIVNNISEHVEALFAKRTHV